MEYRRRNVTSKDEHNTTTQNTEEILINQYTSSSLKEDAKSTKIPYKSIMLAIVLFTIGTVLLVVGSLLVSGIWVPAEYADRTIPVLILSCIAFIPGSYHTFIAWASYRQYKGYSYSQIPSFDD